MGSTLPLHAVTMSDMDWFKERVAESRGAMSCDYTFGNAFIWRYPYDVRVADYKGFLCRTDGNGKDTVYTMPVGKGDLRDVINDMTDDAAAFGAAFILRGVTEADIASLRDVCPGRFDFRPRDDQSDYLYLRDNLANLPGKKFHGKRNHIARFTERDDWAYEPITADNVDAAFDMALAWCVRHDCKGVTSLNREFCAVKQAFANFFELGLNGGVLKADGEIIGVTAGERLNDDVYVVHIEKAYHEIQGAYPTINREFSSSIPTDCRYVNREEDDGDEGLRRAKMSYHPDLILRKYDATLVCQRAAFPALSEPADETPLPCAV